MDLPSDLVRKGLLLLGSGYVRGLAAASYPHIQCGGGDFPSLAGGVCGGWRLIHSVIPVVTLLGLPIGARPSRPRIIGPGE